MRHVLAKLALDAEMFEANGCLEGLQIMSAHSHIALVLLDLNMPEMDGFTAIGLIKSYNPSVPIIVLSASESHQDARRALELGAAGYIPKSANSQVMLGAIHLVMSGGIYVPPLILNQLQQVSPDLLNLQASSAAEKPVGDNTLTVRQMDVLRLLAQGKSNKEISRVLNMAEGTVKIHITAIFKNLNVVNRTQALMAANKLGITS